MLERSGRRLFRTNTAGAGLLLLLLVSVAHAGESEGKQAAGEASPVPQKLLLQYLAHAGTFTLIDARSAEEFSDSHIEGAINIPLQHDEQQMAALPASLDAPLVVYCRTGKRARELQNALQKLGYRNVRTLSPEQVFWGEGLAVFNCAAGAATDSGLQSTVQSTRRQEGESE
jgi:rhodanese-related sulfurtransferase